MTLADQRREVVRRARLRALGALLRPTPEETLLLRALLWRGDEGRQAWQAWEDGRPADAPPRENVKALLPMLYVSLRENGVEPGGDFGSRIRAAHVREELRGATYRRILLTLLDGFEAEGAPVVLVGGSAFAETVYPAPLSRHSHGVRLLVSRAEDPRVVGALRRSCFEPVRRPETARPFSWRHGSGLPVELRASPLPFLRPGLDADEIRSRARPLAELHPHVRILAPEDALLEVCARAAMTRSRGSLRWACDAWLLLDRRGDALSWPRMLRDIRSVRLSPSLFTLLDYLTRELGAAVPDAVLETLAAEADRAEVVDQEIALLGALPGSHPRLWEEIRGTRGARLRLALLRPLLLPSPRALRATLPASASVPLAYVARPWRHLMHRVRGIG